MVIINSKPSKGQTPENDWIPNPRTIISIKRGWVFRLFASFCACVLNSAKNTALICCSRSHFPAAAAKGGFSPWEGGFANWLMAQGTKKERN